MSPKTSTERGATAVAANSVVCPQCSAQVKPGRKFCTQCGTPLQATSHESVTEVATESRLCPECGAPNRPADTLCRTCGASLSSPDLSASRAALAAPVAEPELEKPLVQEPPAIETGKPAGALTEPMGEQEEEESSKEAALRKLRERALSQSPEVEKPWRAPVRVSTGILVAVMVALGVVILLILHYLGRPTRPGQKAVASAAAIPSPVTSASAATLTAAPAGEPPAAGTGEESSPNNSVAAPQSISVSPAPPVRSAVTDVHPSAPARPVKTPAASPSPRAGPAAPTAVADVHPNAPAQPVKTPAASPSAQAPAVPSSVTEAGPSAPGQPAATPPVNQSPKANPAASSAEASAQTRTAPREIAQQMAPPSPSAASLGQLPSPSVPAPGKLASPAAPVSHATEPLRVGGQVQAGKLLDQPAANYPAIARDAGIQGVVRLKVLIGKDGKVRKASVIAGNTLLGRAAVDAVLKWRYQPTELDGQPVEVTTEVDLAFKLPE